MKKSISIFAFILFTAVLVLTGCTDKTAIKQVYQKDAVIDYHDCTITYDGEIYHYEYSNNKLKITYPNNMVSVLMNKDSFISIDWQYVEAHKEDVKTVLELGYLHPNVIMYQILEATPNADMPSNAEGQSPIAAFFVILIGSMMVVFPATAWAISYGWRYKDVKPSEIAIVVHRFSGVLAIIIGIIMLA